MKTKYFELICDKKINYINDLIDYLTLNIEEVITFFELKNIN